MKFTMYVDELNNLITAANTYGDKTHFSNGNVVTKMKVVKWKESVCIAECTFCDNIKAIQVVVALNAVSENDVFLSEGAFDSFYMAIPSKKYKRKPEFVMVEIETNTTSYHQGGVTEGISFDAKLDCGRADGFDLVWSHNHRVLDDSDNNPMYANPQVLIAALELFAKEDTVQIERLNNYYIRIRPKASTSVPAQGFVCLKKQNNTEFYNGSQL